MAPSKYKKCQQAFPRVRKTQKGQMRTQRQGVRSTKTQQSTRAFTPEEATSVQTPIPKKKDIFIKIYSPKNTMYTDQTGKFPYSSSRGNNYHRIIHETDWASTWVEVMKNRPEGEMIKARRPGLFFITSTHVEAQSFSSIIIW